MIKICEKNAVYDIFSKISDLTIFDRHKIGQSSHFTNFRATSLRLKQFWGKTHFWTNLSNAPLYIADQNLKFIWIFQQHINWSQLWTVAFFIIAKKEAWSFIKNIEAKSFFRLIYWQFTKFSQHKGIWKISHLYQNFLINISHAQISHLQIHVTSPI